jgi:hypothetical protein
MVPGPGAYESTLKHKNAAPGYGIGTQKRTSSQAAHNSPGPNVYNPGMGPVQNKSSAWGFGTD